MLSFALGYAIFYGKLRYRIPILPIVLGFAGLGVASLGGRVNRSRSWSRQWPAPLAGEAPRSRFLMAEPFGLELAWEAYIGPCGRVSIRL